MHVGMPLVKFAHATYRSRIPAGPCYHLNRGDAQGTVFHKDGDFAAFVKLLKEVNCAGPNCGRICSRIKAVRILPIWQRVSRIVVNFGEVWRPLCDAVGKTPGRSGGVAIGMAKSVRDGGFPNSCDFGDVPGDWRDAVGKTAGRVAQCWDRNGKVRSGVLTPWASISFCLALSRSDPAGARGRRRRCGSHSRG